MYFVVALQKKKPILVDCHYLGINNVMALRWCYERRTIFCSKIGNNFAVDLVQIKLLNEGKYMHDVMHVDNKADFVLSSGLSEKHLESPSLLSDLKG
jgi:methylenetetrahydrofolate reductase (NADPH)